MTAATRDIVIEQGATFTFPLVYKDSNDVPVNLTGYTARMQVRRSKASTTAVLTLTTENGSITLGGSAGTIDIVASAEDTAAIPIKVGVYDLELVSPSGNVKRLIEGEVTISQEVTKNG